MSIVGVEGGQELPGAVRRASTSSSSEGRVEEQVSAIDHCTDVPDGGLRAWLTVVGASLALFSSFGLVRKRLESWSSLTLRCQLIAPSPSTQINSYGIFENYYKSHRLSNQNQSVIALIGATQLFLVFGVGPVVGKIFDSYGSKVNITFPLAGTRHLTRLLTGSYYLQHLLLLGTACVFASQMLLSVTQTEKIYQYFLTQGFLLGIGGAMIVTPALAIVRHYFDKKKGLAFGLISAGSSLGGFVFPIILQKLFAKIGFAWSVRVAGFLSLTLLIVVNLLLRTRLPRKPTTKKELLKLADMGGFKDPRYCCMAASVFLWVKDYSDGILKHTDIVAQLSFLLPSV
jgi:MCP family monocarboxylic acid transporter-like MFS transporter 10